MQTQTVALATTLMLFAVVLAPLCTAALFRVPLHPRQELPRQSFSNAKRAIETKYVQSFGLSMEGSDDVPLSDYSQAQYYGSCPRPP